MLIKFGKWVLREGYYIGRHVKQLENGDILIDQEKFLTERLAPITMHKDRKKHREELAIPSEILQLRAVLGALGWLTRERMWPYQGDTNILMTCMPTPRVADLLRANEIVGNMKKEWATVQ